MSVFELGAMMKYLNVMLHFCEYVLSFKLVKFRLPPFTLGFGDYHLNMLQFFMLINV